MLRNEVETLLRSISLPKGMRFEDWADIGFLPGMLREEVDYPLSSNKGPVYLISIKDTTQNEWTWCQGDFSRNADEATIRTLIAEVIADLMERRGHAA